MQRVDLAPGYGISIYPLAAVLPPSDWMTTDAEIACPDPNCATRLRITRTGSRRFSHAAVAAVPLAEG